MSTVAAALGIALQRVCELTYGWTPVGAQISERLLELQRIDGLFGGRSGGRTAGAGASAVAVKGLMAWRDHVSEATGEDVGQHGPADRGQSPATEASTRARLNRAIDAALHAISDAQVDPTVESEIIRWQLGARGTSRCGSRAA